MLNPGSPCKDCGKRRMNCHSACDSYIEYKAKLGENNSEYRRLYESTGIYKGYVKAKKERAKIK